MSAPVLAYDAPKLCAPDILTFKSYISYTVLLVGLFCFKRMINCCHLLIQESTCLYILAVIFGGSVLGCKLGRWWQFISCFQYPCVFSLNLDLKFGNLLCLELIKNTLLNTYGSFPFTGPMLSSGMCTEVFQFDASPAPGAIIPASSVSNVPAKHLKNATRLSKGRNRRILNRLPIPVAGSNYNITEEHVRNSSQKESFQGNKSSTMIVSVLVDPREAGDSEVDGMIAPKSLSRIFVVVLMDSVKYVTYSCVLPRSGLI